MATLQELFEQLEEEMQQTDAAHREATAAAEALEDWAKARMAGGLIGGARRVTDREMDLARQRLTEAKHQVRKAVKRRNGKLKQLKSAASELTQ